MSGITPKHTVWKDLKTMTTTNENLPTLAEKAIENLRQGKPNPNYRPMIYICAPYTAVVMNNRKVIEQVESYCRFVYECGGIPICPQLYLPRFLNLHNYAEFNTSIFMSVVWMRKCAELWVFGSLPVIWNGKSRRLKRRINPSVTSLNLWRLLNEIYTLHR